MVSVRISVTDNAQIVTLGRASAELVGCSKYAVVCTY